MLRLREGFGPVERIEIFKSVRHKYLRFLPAVRVSPFFLLAVFFKKRE